jgi:hypothetical protein
MDYKIGYEVKYKPTGNLYKIIGFSTLFGKKFAHLKSETEGTKVLRVLLPLSEAYLCIPDNAFDMLDI